MRRLLAIIIVFFVHVLQAQPVHNPMLQWKAGDKMQQLSAQQLHWIDSPQLHTQFSIVNTQTTASTLLIKTPNVWQVQLSSQSARTGKLQSSVISRNEPVINRTVPHYQPHFLVELQPGDTAQIHIALSAGFSIYQKSPLQVEVLQQDQFEQTDRDRHFWQGMFLGVILVMALYNLFLFFSVKDTSYLHYVLSIAGIGLYFAYYYGFGIEHMWPNSPRWDTWSYTIIVPFTSLARLWFTRTYLNTPVLLPRTNALLTLLNILMSGTLLIGIGTYVLNIDWLAPLVTIIGILNTLILVLMLVAGIDAYNRNYKPALYFITANALLVAGAILFIFREMGMVGDNWFTRYFVQVGVVVQVVLFALGLASRYNQTRQALEEQRLEKERIALETEKEKKQLIEEQKIQLQLQIEAQTLSLRNQNEKLQELNSLKDKLFSVITHDLRNPLATMQSFLKLLTEHHEKLSEAEKQKLMAEAQDSLDHLNRLLFHLLQWSKSQMNLLAFQPEQLDARESLEKCVRILHLQAHLKKITIETDVDNPCPLHADQQMIDFILRNLLSNAIKFSHMQGHILLKAWVAQQHTYISIQDSGIGISADVVNEILTTHVGATRRGTAKERGTGLGLLISREFIEKHGGQLFIESHPGSGTLMTIAIPLKPKPQGIDTQV